MAYWPLSSFNVGQIVPAAFMNRLVDNINHFRTPPQYLYNRGFADANYTVASTTFQDVDVTNMNPTILFTGNPVLVTFMAGRMTLSGATQFSLSVDGIDISGGNSLCYVATTNLPVFFQRVVTGLSPGLHSVKPIWKAASGTSTLFAANGIQFYVREL